MSSSSFDKASSKLLGEFAGGANVVTPVAGKRMSREEREAIIERESSEDPVAEAQPVETTHAAVEKRGAGRPRTPESLKDPKPINFMVEGEFRKALKMWAAERGVDLKDLMLEGIQLLLEKHQVNLSDKYDLHW